MGPNGDEVQSSRSILWVVRAAWKQCCFFALTERVQTDVICLRGKGLERVGFSCQIGLIPVELSAGMASRAEQDGGPIQPEQTVY